MDPIQHLPHQPEPAGRAQPTGPFEATDDAAIDQVLAAAAAELGISGLSWDAQRACGIAWGDTLQVDLHHVTEGGVIHLTGVVGVTDPNHHGLLAPLLLQANADPAEVGDAHFAIDPRNDEVLLCRTVAIADLGVIQLSTALTRLVEACRLWQERLTERQLAELPVL